MKGRTYTACKKKAQSVEFILFYFNFVKAVIIPF